MEAFWEKKTFSENMYLDCFWEHSFSTDYFSNFACFNKNLDLDIGWFIGIMSASNYLNFKQECLLKLAAQLAYQAKLN